MFKQIVTVTWETNLGTGVVTMVDLIVFLESSTNWHVALNILMVKCYIMSFLFTRKLPCSLQSRTHLHPLTPGRSSQSTLVRSMHRTRTIWLGE